MPKNQETYLVIHGKNIIEKIDYINCESVYVVFVKGNVIITSIK